MANTYDILGVGFSVLDWVVLCDGFPLEDVKIPAKGVMTQGGGPCATALATACKLGATAAFVGVVGQDDAARATLSDFERYGVCTDYIRVQEGAASACSTVIVNVQNGKRTCLWTYGSVARTAKEDVPLSVLRSAKILHLDAHMMDTAIWAAERARQAGVLVSLDAGTPYEGIEKLLPLVDVLIPCENFALRFTGCADVREAAKELYRRYRPRTLAVTMGPLGGVVFEDGEPKQYDAFSVKAVDTNGAGDVFHGAFLAATLKGMDDTTAARYASAAAAIKCRGVGARQSAPTAQEIESFFGSGGKI